MRCSFDDWINLTSEYLKDRFRGSIDGENDDHRLLSQTFVDERSRAIHQT